MKGIITIGIDLAKNTLQLHGVDANGKTVLRKSLKQDHVAVFFAKFSDISCRNGGLRYFGLLGAYHWILRPYRAPYPPEITAPVMQVT